MKYYKIKIYCYSKISFLRKEVPMEYNEKLFKESANKKARLIWIFLLIVCTLIHLTQLNEAMTLGAFIGLVLIGWIPYIVSRIFIKIKGEDWRYYRDCLALGYGMFYTYAVCVSPLTYSFVFIFPIVTMIILYNDYTTCLIYVNKSLKVF